VKAASAGKLVMAGLKGSEQAHPDLHGHVVVVVDGTPDPYPRAYWGRLGGSGEKDTSIRWAWTAQDRDRVSYSEHNI
jgi:hypothetical protein